ncbi:hypothetical protein ACFQ69_36815 [Streptomyces sp. NPDC056470]|uniref:hypothetical protein n=1 Tax=Streptomyces sp. NPDC056470 TaxID=3345831 RepID=UPI0036761B95
MKHINLGCSGGETKHIGGVGFKGEAPQDSRLDQLARMYDVKAVTLTVGANDMAWAEVVKDCIASKWLLQGPCRESKEGQTKNAIGSIQPRLLESIYDITNTMRRAGYVNGSYKLIVQSYISYIAPSAELIVPPPGGPFGDCDDFHPSDADWFRTNLVPRINGALLSAVKTARKSSDPDYMGLNIQYLDRYLAFKGHELCSKKTARAHDAPVSMETAEWAVQLNYVGGTNRTVESFHPNYYGQLALGRCLEKLYNTPGTGDYKCENTAGAGGVNMSLTPFQTPHGSNYMHSEDHLNGGQCKYSAPSGTTRLCMQTNGNLVVQTGNSFATQTWSSNTFMTGISAWLRDGHLYVINGANSAVYWNSNWGNYESYLKVQDNGKVIIYTMYGHPLWMTPNPPNVPCQDGCGNDTF